MSGGRRAARWAGAAAAAILAGPAAAQEPGGAPVIVTPQVELDWLEVYDTRAILEVEWRTNYNEVDPAGGERRSRQEDRLREILDLRSRAYLGHPNLLELDLGVRLRPEQLWFKPDSGDSEFVSQFLVDWDVSGLFFKETKLPITLYTRQNTSTVDREFGSSLENTFREYGVRVSLRSSVAPTTVQVFQRKIEQRDTTADEGFTIDRFTIRADGRIERNQNQRMAWDAQFDNVDEDGERRTPRSFDRFEANVTHALDFGEDLQSGLRTQLRYYNRSGDQALEQFRALPRLRLWHSPSLNTWYDYRFDWNRRPEQELFNHEATASFQYRAFDSLTMIGTGGVNLFEITTEDFNSDEVFADIDVQYIKEVPLGVLEANVNGLFSTTDQSKRGAAIQVSDDLFTFTPFSFVIDQRNVEPASIIITNLTGLFTYTENVDYRVLGFADQVQIQQIAGGDIVPGQSVLVDYVIGPDPGGTTDRTGYGVDLRYTFRETFLRNVSLYMNYFDQDERRSIVTEDFPENDFTDFRYGIEYDVWKLYFKAERRHRDSTLSPFKETRLEARYTEPLGRGSSLVFSALYQDIDRTDDDLRQETTTYSGQWNQRIDQRLSMSLLAQYRHSEDGRSFDTDSYDGQFDLTWRYRQTEVYTQLRASFEDATTNDNTFARFKVGIRREF